MLKRIAEHPKSSIAVEVSSCALHAARDLGRTTGMANKGSQTKKPIQVALEGTLLGYEGRELKPGLWETCVYLGNDGFVYHLTALQKSGGIQPTIEGKRAIGEYLRWVDGLFRPGELPSASTGVHYRAARLLRELI